MQEQEKSAQNLKLLCLGLTQVVRQDGRVIFSGDSIFDSKYCLIGRVSTDVRMMKICNMLCNVQCLLAAIQMTLLRQLACVKGGNLVTTPLVLLFYDSKLGMVG